NSKSTYDADKFIFDSHEAGYDLDPTAKLAQALNKLLEDHDRQKQRLTDALVNYLESAKFLVDTSLEIIGHLNEFLDPSLDNHKRLTDLYNLISDKRRKYEEKSSDLSGETGEK